MNVATAVPLSLSVSSDAGLPPFHDEVGPGTPVKRSHAVTHSPLPIVVFLSAASFIFAGQEWLYKIHQAGDFAPTA
jgi:hypothetical protein